MTKGTTPSHINPFIASNIVWFLASLILAIWVWYIATAETNPIQQRRFRAIPVQFEVDEGFIITNNPTTTASVTVIGQQSVIELLTNDDIVVRANLRGLSAGTHVVPLNAAINRQNALADTQPTQITVTLEQIVALQKPIELRVVEAPPTDFSYEDPPQLDIRQAEVRGAGSQVNRVVKLIAEIDLSDYRNPIDLTARLTAVDANGATVEGVTINPNTTNVAVNIFRRDDVRQVSVSPRILVSTLPPGYLLSSLSYEPQVIFVGGSPAQLDAIGDTFFTQAIDLTNRTASFEITVPIELPDSGLLILDSSNQVNVKVEIVPQTTVEQIDNIPIEIIGLDSRLTATSSPLTLSVVLNGPVAILDQIELADVTAVIDLAGLEAGNYTIAPDVLINQGQTQVDSITLLPPSVEVVIRDNTIAPTASPTATTP